MFRRISSLPAVLVLALAISSCERVDIEVGQTGYLCVDLQQDLTIDPVFKSDAAEDMTFSITVRDHKDEVIAVYDDHRELATQPLELRAGFVYKVSASSSETGAAAFDAPFYTGSTEVEIKEKIVNTVPLTVSLANVKVTASFSDEIKEKFSEYVLTVTNGEGALTYSSLDGSIDNVGYFSVTGTLSWTLKMLNKDDAEHETGIWHEVSDSYSDVQPRQHYNLQFSLDGQEEFGGASVKVTLDDSTKDKTYNLLLDFEADVRPTVYSSLDMFQTVQFAEGEPVEATFDLKIPGGASYIEISHSVLALSSNGLPWNFKIMDLDVYDRTHYNGKGMILPEITKGAKSAHLDFSGLFQKLPMGTYQIKFYIESLNGKNRTQYCNFVIAPSVEVDAVSATCWAQIAFLTGKWYPDTRPEGISFQYRKQAASEWTDVDPNAVDADDASKTYSAEVWGLDAGTTYVFRAVSALDSETKEKTFTTENAGTIPNMGFDLWYKSGDIWYPNENSGQFYWDTANGGSSTVGVFPTSPEDSHVKSGRAAKLESKSVTLVELAAGNIYTGKFVKANISFSNPGAELDWGVPFSSRPLALKGYVDYRPGTINKTKAPYNNMSGKPDIANVQVFLTDWSAPFRISTSSGKFVDYDNDSGIIARGTADFNKTDGYIEFTIPLTYRSTTRIPRYLVIAASASKYGDYFTGSTSSVMYVDEFSFVYDPSDLTEEELAIVKYK